MKEKLSVYYTAQDIMKILHCGRSKAYGLIRRLNSELNKQGKLTFPGRLSRKYFHARTC